MSLYAMADLATPWAIRVAATLRIADHIAAGTGDVEKLAAATGCDAGALRRVLNHLADRGIFADDGSGRFVMTELAESLRDPATHIALDLNGIGGRMAHGWSTLLTYVRTGAPGYHEIFGRPFWEDLDAHPDLAESFDALIGTVGHGPPNANFEIVGGWDAVTTVVDVGGGTGSMLAAVLRAHPHLRGTLVDLPRTVARSAPVFEAAGVSDRASTVGQSFFDPLPAGADLYLVKNVLNDWPDRETGMILRRCAEAARPGGRVVVMGGVGPDGGRPGLSEETPLVGGTSHPLAEFGKIAEENGLEVRSARPQPAGYYVECASPTR
jgi:hypothetical protein